jgi:hypothetical protein
MAVFPRIVVLLSCTWFLVSASAGTAGSLDTCAQRVIRDWYSGGRVDGVYPLACYRAAIRALPNDVLEYSDADLDIARALAFARRGRNDPGQDAGASSAATPAATDGEAPDAPAGNSAEEATTETTQPTARAQDEAVARPADGPVNLASGADPADVSAAVPYPVIVLAALAATLLATGAAGWLLARRR